MNHDDPLTLLQPQLGLGLDEPPRRVPIPAGMRWDVLARYDHTCAYCGKRTHAAQLELDHAIPVAEGGLTIADNLVVACVLCNRGKGARPLDPSNPSHRAILARATAAHARVAAQRQRDEEARKGAVLSVQDQQFLAYWRTHLGDAELPGWTRLHQAREIIGFEGLLAAVDTTVKERRRIRKLVRNYFCGVLARMEKGEP